MVETPLVSIILPTLGRSEGLKRCLDSIEALHYPKEKIEVIVIKGDGTVPEKVERGRQKAKGDYFVFASNDIEFTENSLGLALAAMQFEKKGLCAFNTGPLIPDHGNINEHFIITRELTDKLGYIFDLDFWHVGCDNWLWVQAKRLNQAMRCEEAIVRHYHWSKGGEMDEVYKKGWSHVEEDRALLVKKIAAL